MKSALSVIISVMCLSLPALGTEISGELATTTWTSEGSPYHVTNTVTVPAGNTLTIEAGVDVIFDADVQFVVEGRLHAHGTETDSIRFLAGEMLQWGGIRISGGDTSTIQYARISGGHARLPDGFEGNTAGLTCLNGGGISLSGSRLGLVHVVLERNRAELGGGIHATGQSLVTLDNCTVSQNSAGVGGGVFVCDTSSTVLRNTRVSGNRSEGTGGGISVFRYSSFTAEDCIIQQNEANRGAAASASRSWSAIRRCEISGNSATEDAAGLDFVRMQSALVSECSITGNTTQGSGGAFFMSETDASVERCFITGNSALRGGAVFCRNGGATTLQNCTVSNNTATEGGGAVYAVSQSADAVTSVQLQGAILWGNTPDEIGIDPVPGTSYTHHGTVAAEYSDIGADGIWNGAGVINADPLFTNPALGDYTLSDGSPCIDTGNPYIGDPDGTRSDMGAGGGGGSVPLIPRISVTLDTVIVMIGEPEPVVVSNTGGADLTIYEIGLSSGFVTSMVFPKTIPPGGSLNIPITFDPDGPAVGSLTMYHSDVYQECVTVVLEGFGYTAVQGCVSGVWDKAHSPYHVVGPVTVLSGRELRIEPGVEVVFDADVPLTVQGRLFAEGTVTDSILFVPGAAGEWQGLRFFGKISRMISYVRISGASANDSHPLNKGGGIYCNNAVLMLSHVVVRDNAAQSAGGGLYAYESRITINECRFINNRTVSSSGGAMMLTQYSVVNMSDCVIEGNSAAGRGGGLDIAGSSVSLIQCAVLRNTSNGDGGGVGISQGLTEAYGFSAERCVFASNTAGGAGGGMSVSSTPVSLVNCTVTGNGSGKRGSGIKIFYLSGDASLTNTIVWGNTPLTGLDAPEETTVRYSVTQHPWEGEGNICDDPLLADISRGDYSLRTGSPCIDAGDPSYLDEDGTRCDMGVTGGTGNRVRLPLLVRSTPFFVGSAHAETLRVENSGDAAVTVMGFIVDEPFASSISLPVTIPANSTLGIPVSFTGGSDTTGTAILEHTHPHQLSLPIPLAGVVGTGLRGETARILTAEGNPYRVLDTLTVASNQTLTICSGVVIKVDRDVPIVVQGQLVTDGTETSPVRFESGMTGSWQGLDFVDSEGSVLAYADISGSVNSGISLVRSELSAHHCTVHDNGNVDGAGIRSVESSINLSECIIADNEAWVSFNVSGRGGGLSILGSDAVLQNCEISENVSGGFYSESTSSSDSRVVMYDCVIHWNCYGGISVHRNSCLRAIRCEISNNIVSGVGVSIAQSQIDMDSCLVQGNYGDGGIALESATGTITRTRIDRNGGFYGGGVAVSGVSDITMRNCLVTQNSAAWYGGGILVSKGQLALINCTLYKNNARTGSEIYAYHIRETVTRRIVSMINTIVWGYDTQDAIYTGEGNTTELSAEYSDIQCVDVMEGTGNINADPCFVDSESGDFSLQDSSRCRDSGSPYIMDADGSRSDMGASGGTGERPEIPRIEVAETDLVLSDTESDTLCIYNTGGADLVVEALTLPDDFMTPLAFPRTISPDDSLTVPVACAGNPDAVGKAVIYHSDGFRPEIPVTYVVSRGVEEPQENESSSEFALYQNAPNPFNPTTTVWFSMAEAGQVTVSIYDVQGRRVCLLVDEGRNAGVHQVTWDGRDNAGRVVASGVYICRMVTTNRAFVKRMLLVR